MPARPEKLWFVPKTVQELDGRITEDEVKDALKHASDNKAPGLDKIPNEFWKNLPDIQMDKQ